MIGVDAFDSDMAERSRGSKPASVVDHRGECRLPGFEFVDRRPLDCARDCNQGTRGRDEKSVPAFKGRTPVADAVKQEIVEIDIFNELLPTVVMQRAKRARGGRA